MRRISIWIMIMLTALVLLFSYHTSTNTTQAVTASALTPRTVASSWLRSDGSAGTTTTPPSFGASGASSSGSGTGGSSAADSGTASRTASSGSGAATTDTKTYTGDSVMTRYGAVQVELMVSDGQVSEVKAVDSPFSNGRDQAINSYAVPILDQEASTAKSAQIDMVSGATFTSGAYIQSLLSALGEANL